MSRTYNTMPYQVQEKILEAWRFKSGYPAAVGGAWPNRTEYARRRNRQFRFAAKNALRQGKEIPKFPSKVVAWDIW